VSFRRDRVTQSPLIFLGAFLYGMAVLPAEHALPGPFSPVVTVVGAITLAIVCVGLLLFFIHHISQAIRVKCIVDRIASETETVVDAVMPLARKQVHLETSGSAEPKSGGRCFSYVADATRNTARVSAVPGRGKDDSFMTSL